METGCALCQAGGSRRAVVRVVAVAGGTRRGESWEGGAGCATPMEGAIIKQGRCGLGLAGLGAGREGW